MKIPIPPMEKQELYVEYLDNINEITNDNKNKIDKYKRINEINLKIQLGLNKVEIKTLGEVCEVNQGNPLTKTEMINGIYNVIGGGKIIGKHNQKNRDGNDFTLTRVGDININYIDKSYYLTDNGFSLKSIQKDIITKYVYYLLLYNKNYLINLYQGTAQKVISKTNLKSIKIPIPSLEVQNKIVENLDYNNEIISNLEKEIELTKTKSKELFKQIL